MEILLAVFTIVGAVVGIIAMVHQFYLRKLEKVNKAWNDSISDSQLSLKGHRFLSKRYRLRTALRRVIVRHLYYSDEKFDAGTYEEGGVLVNYYLDLMEAVVNPHDLRVMAKNLACYIRDSITYDYNIVAVPKNGNPLLGVCPSN